MMCTEPTHNLPVHVFNLEADARLRLEPTQPWPQLNGKHCIPPPRPTTHHQHLNTHARTRTHARTHALESGPLLWTVWARAP